MGGVEWTKIKNEDISGGAIFGNIFINENLIIMMEYVFIVSAIDIQGGIIVSHLQVYEGC